MRLAIGTGGPDVADGYGEEDGGGVFGAGVGDVFADVPAVGVDGLGGLAGDGAGGEGFGEGDVDGLVAEALDAAAVLGVFGYGFRAAAAVVVAHLDEDVVAGLHLGEDVRPRGPRCSSCGSCGRRGAVGDVDFGGVEEGGEVVTPAQVGSVAGGGVAYYE